MDGECRFVNSGMVAVGFVSLAIFIMSCTSDPVFNVYYDSIMGALGVRETAFANFVIDSPKLGHVLVYAVLILIILFSTKMKVLWAIGITFLFGIVMEVAQLFIPSREALFSDLLFNLYGIIIGFVLYCGLTIFLKRSCR